jgi:hypothetical protein
MMSRRRGVVSLLLAATLLPAAAAAQQTPEEIRHQAELRACAALPEAERKPCEDRVRAKITAEWKARIEEQARRRTSN